MISDGYIDIHMHVIPDVDDGAANMRMSLNMLELARKEGITTVFCTPHYGEFGKPVRPREYVDAQFEQLVKFAKERVPDVTLLRGNELFFRRDIPKKLEENRACTMNGTNYLLVEFEPEEGIRDIYEDLSFLVDSGFTPILAHAERNFDLADHKKFADKLIELGVLLQVNADSLMIERIKPFKKLAKYLLTEGKATFLATDSHGDDYRVPYYKPAVEWLYLYCEVDYVDGLVVNNAKRLLCPDVEGGADK